MWNFDLIPEQASTFAPKVDLLYYSLWVFLLAFTIGVTAIFLYFGLKYRRVPGSGRRSVHVENLPIEITWTLIPVGIAISIFAWGAILFFDYTAAPDDALEISVIGKQWMWKVQHANGKREVNELHVPANRPVKLVLQSQDVIHSFYVPAFRVKQDVLPARWTSLWFEATKPGVYHLFCAEYCGTDHSVMTGSVTVMEPQEYEEWLGGGMTITPVVAGESLFQQMGCATCHAAGDTQRGPGLEGLFGSEVALRGGETVVADEEYLRESIMMPPAKVVDGYAPLMPSYQTQLEEEDVFNLIAYIKTLKGNGQEQ